MLACHLVEFCICSWCRELISGQLWQSYVALSFDHWSLMIKVGLRYVWLLTLIIDLYWSKWGGRSVNVCHNFIVQMYNITQYLNKTSKIQFIQYNNIWEREKSFTTLYGENLHVFYGVLINALLISPFKLILALEKQTKNEISWLCPQCLIVSSPALPPKPTTVSLHPLLSFCSRQRVSQFPTGLFSVMTE